MSDFIMNILVLLFGKIPLGILVGALIGWIGRGYVLRRNPALIKKLDDEANALVDQAKAKLDAASK